MGLMFPSISFAQMAEVTYQVWFNSAISYPEVCSEDDGGREYVATKPNFRDNVNQGFDTLQQCYTCTSLSQCLYGTPTLISTRTNTSHIFYPGIIMFENDDSQMCEYDPIEDDCGFNPLNTLFSINFRDAITPLPPGGFWFLSFGDFQHVVHFKWNWKYSGSVNPLYPVPVADSAYYIPGGVRSWSVELEAGKTYEFWDCGTGTSATTLTLYKTNGYSLATVLKTTCGPKSSLLYVATETGWHYLEIGKTNSYRRTSTVAGGMIYYREIPPVSLPVELISFTAKAIDNQFIQLNWSTATEINNLGFEIHRSVDGEDWSNIGWVPGNGNSTNTLNYAFQDHEVTSGTYYYYRLKQIDFDGQFEYSDVVSAAIEGRVDVVAWDFVISPNPSSDRVSITIQGSTEPQALSIIDIAGKVIEHISLHSLDMLLPIDHLQSGLYLVKIQTNQGVKTQRFVKK